MNRVGLSSPGVRSAHSSSRRSPTSGPLLLLFLLFMGVVFTYFIFAPGQVIELRELADFSRFALFFVVPLVTMSLFADEYRSGRIEMLRTSPITEFDLLLGKFLGAMTFFLVLIGSTLIYLVVLMFFGKPDFWQVASCYFGMCLMGAMFVSIGLFFSACTAEQIVAAMAGMITLGALTIPDLFSQSLTEFLHLLGRFPSAASSNISPSARTWATSPAAPSNSPTSPIS